MEFTLAIHHRLFVETLAGFVTQPFVFYQLFIQRHGAFAFENFAVFIVLGMAPYKPLFTCIMMSMPHQVHQAEGGRFRDGQYSRPGNRVHLANGVPFLQRIFHHVRNQQR